MDNKQTKVPTIDRGEYSAELLTVLKLIIYQSKEGSEKVEQVRYKSGKIHLQLIL